MNAHHQMNSREVRNTFKKFWEARCKAIPAYRNDLPAKRQAFSVFVDDLQCAGRISDRVANSVTLEEHK